MISNAPMAVVLSCVAALWDAGPLWSQEAATKPERISILEVTDDIELDPKIQYGAIVIRRSGIRINGNGALLEGPGMREGVAAKTYQGTAILGEGVSDVTLRNVTARGWETGLVVRDAAGWLIEGCDFSDNFHDPEFGWGENGRRGGIVLERVSGSVLLRNRANRVWDACVLVNSSDNLLEGNDFSRCSNTCLKLWTACGNTIRDNTLSYGIRIAPGEVHARDSTCVLMESGSNDNSLIRNDCTHGGDGIFVRVLNGWCSTGNHFEKNDCSYANNNGVECWAQSNTFIGNRANHCSYGFWMGGSDKSRLINNEASFNGLPDGQHNSPHLPDHGHAGIVFMFGPSSHTVVRGNVCEGNHGAGIALIGDLESAGRKWKAWHWILDSNVLRKNRWGIYAKHAEWLVFAGNRYEGNVVAAKLMDGDVTRIEDRDGNADGGLQTGVPVVGLRAILNGPEAVRVGEAAEWNVDASSGGTEQPLTFRWDLQDGQERTGASLRHRFERPGFYRIGLNVSNGHSTEPLWRDVYVVSEGELSGTEQRADGWTLTDFHERQRSSEQRSRMTLRLDETEKLVGRNSVRAEINPYAGFRVAMTWTAKEPELLETAGRRSLCFWLKSINEDVTGWQGGPFIVLRGAAGELCYLEPAKGRDLMRELEHNEARDGWRLFEIPLAGDERWTRDGDIPRTVTAISLCFDSWGAPPLRLWVDGMGLR